jgi:hypothetical protein
MRCIIFRHISCDLRGYSVYTIYESITYKFYWLALNFFCTAYFFVYNGASPSIFLS